MYTDRNFRTKKALKEAFEKGQTIYVYQPGPFGDRAGSGLKDCFLEGPHYPEPHRWYAQGRYDAQAMLMVTLKGSKARWVQAPDGSYTFAKEA